MLKVDGRHSEGKKDYNFWQSLLSEAGCHLAGQSMVKVGKLYTRNK
jgi:hypothetical protein